MHGLASLLLMGLLAWSIAARSHRYVERMLPEGFRPRGNINYEDAPKDQVKRRTYSRPTIISQNKNTTKFAVDGTSLPDVDFDIGESYAGLLPVSSKQAASELYFWFFPSSNPEAADEITIWLNGGPGCSSLEGFLQENGPVLWQYGTYKPVKNPWTWVHLTNMVWVEQPVGTGFSQGKPTATNEKEVAAQFLGFFKHFMDTFGLHNKKVYITGESYAGYYVPYIANAMLDKKDKIYYNVEGIMLYDPSTSYDVVQQQIPVVPYIDYWANLFGLNASFASRMHRLADHCGYTEFFNKYLTFPPAARPLPTPPHAPSPQNFQCDLWTQVYEAVSLVNPCFDIYEIATACPLIWDVLGFPGSFNYLPKGASVYFNRTDVQKAINAPIQPWIECQDGVLNRDTSLQSGLSVLPRVIEGLNKTIIGHGALDYVLIANGTLMMIQNMTWHGKQGFQKRPSDPFFVPYHAEVSLGALAASGIMGTTHTERGLTWVEIARSGHMVPQYQPSASYRMVEFMLSRISSLSEHSHFTTQEGRFGNGPEHVKRIRA